MNILDRIAVVKLRNPRMDEKLVKSLVVSEKVKLDILTQPKDNMTALIFAPDPVTGVPRSDMAIMLSRDSAPEVAAYIRDNFQGKLPDSVRLDNPDEVLSLSKRHGEVLTSYADRLQTVITNSYNSEFLNDKSE